MPATEVKSGPLNIVILGLSVTSSWGNSHATTFRSLTKGLAAIGHRVLFLERDVPWYAENRDLPHPPHCRAELYSSLEELKDRWRGEVRQADFVIVGSCVPQGVEVGRWVTRTARACGFYDVDTPVTMAKLAAEDYEYLHPSLVPKYDVYFSFTGGPVLQVLQEQLHSPMAKPLYCSVDPDLYRPVESRLEYDLGYLGTYSQDRQKMLEKLLIDAGRAWPGGVFAIAGSKYPPMNLPPNVRLIQHIPPVGHAEFYCSQAFTLNLTRADMVRAGYSPSVRLFEAAACGVPIISDWWEGLGSFLEPRKEVLVAADTADVLRYLQQMRTADRKAVGLAARQRILASHTSLHRAAELDGHIRNVLNRKARRRGRRAQQPVSVVQLEAQATTAALQQGEGE